MLSLQGMVMLPKEITRGLDILMAGASSVDQMLQGVVPGMLVMNKTGLVGASPKIRVRGTSTLLGSQEPVWVVDGVIQRDPQPFDSEDNTKFSVDADDIRQLAGNAISWLNPNDIETITVLKMLLRQQFTVQRLLMVLLLSPRKKRPKEILL